jgi:hypothetical protein
MDRDNKGANQFGVFGLPVSVFIDEQVRRGFTLGLWTKDDHLLVQGEVFGISSVSLTQPSDE